MADLVLETNSKNSTHSSLRESIIEHIFVGEILKELWLEHITQVEVLKSQVDDAGYDIVIECKRNSKTDHSVPCYIQLKSSSADAKTAKVSVGEKLTKKPNWCVIWVFFDPGTLKLGPFLCFPRSDQDSPDMAKAKYKTTKHTKGDSKGKKAERPGHWDIPKHEFGKPLTSISDVIGRLFPKATGN